MKVSFFSLYFCVPFISPLPGNDFHNILVKWLSERMRRTHGIMLAPGLGHKFFLSAPYLLYAWNNFHKLLNCDLRGLLLIP